MSAPAQAEAIPAVAHPNRDGWIWMALPAGCRRVAAQGGTLAMTLAAAGFEIVDPGERDADAVLLDAGRDRAAVRVAARGAGTAGADLVLVSVGRPLGTVRDRVSRWRRALQMAASPADSLRSGAAAAGARRELRASGRDVSVTPTGDRADSYSVGRGWWRRPPAGAIVAARRRGAPHSTLLDECLEEAGRAIGECLTVKATTVVESGKVLARVETEGSGAAYMLRVGGGSAGVLIDAAVSASRALSRPEVPDAVRSRIAPPVAHGAIGLVRFALEPWVGGESPGSPISPAMWDDCLDFLAALHSAPQGDDLAGRRDERTFHSRVEAVAAHATPEGRATLERLAAGLPERLAIVPRGWGHGDFWPANVLADGGRLAWVLDWDTARSDDLAGFDLFDLLDAKGATTIGARLHAAVLPAVSGRVDERVLRYCELTGMPASGDVLTAAALAWWIDRVSRDLVECPDRQSRRQWLIDNVHDPLARLGHP